MEREEKKQRPSWQEIEEKKINLVKEKGSRVMRVNSPIGSTMFSILRQFDMAYANFKGRLGEMGGITYEEGVALMKEGQEIVMAFSDFTARLSRKVKFRYYPPDEIKDYLELLKAQEKNEEASRDAEDTVSTEP
ncbi:recombinase [Desulfobulbus oligotrophicus]|uniref:Recombinase n=1 Tax=Desulfobulbus oligotrophicus TaxID=1909699 RepID=A0A7T5VB37_9BACT|nr:recombinase [Desulfobulbus oligotrophicus]QQG64615.1 recombinase [Desulfobulbus oligotrophicus]